MKHLLIAFIFLFFYTGCGSRTQPQDRYFSEDIKGKRQHIFWNYDTGHKINKNSYNKSSLLLVLTVLFIQILLGILTLIYVVPFNFAILHQTNATFLLGSMLFAYHRLIYK